MLGRTGSVLNLITSDLPPPEPWPEYVLRPKIDTNFAHLASLQFVCRLPSWRRAEQRVLSRNYELGQRSASTIVGQSSDQQSNVNISRSVSAYDGDIKKKSKCSQQ